MPFNVYRRYQKRAQSPINFGNGPWLKIASGLDGPPFTDENPVEGLAYEYVVSETYPNGIEGPRGHWTAAMHGTPILWPAQIPSLELALETGRGLINNPLNKIPATEDGDPIGVWPDQHTPDVDFYAGGQDFVQSTDARKPVLQNRPNFREHVYFDGSSKYLEESDKNLMLTDAFTIIALVRFEALESLNPIFSRWKDDTDERSVDLRAVGDGSVELHLSSDGVAETAISSEEAVMQSGKTNHIGATYDGAANAATLWVNGEKVASTASAPASLYDPSIKFMMGRSMHGGSWSYLNGGVAMARAFTEALADEQMPRTKRQSDVYAEYILATGEDIPETEKPKFLLDLDGRKGMYADQAGTKPSAEAEEVERWNDQSGAGNDFIAESYTESPFRQSDGPDFDGTDDWMREENKYIDLTTGFTIGTRIAPEDETDVNPIVGQWNGTTPELSFSMAFNGTNVEVRLSSDGSTEDVKLVAPGVVSTGAYNSILVVYDPEAGTLTIYVDGNQEAQDSSAPASLHRSGEAVEIGRVDFGGTKHYFNGDWKRLLLYSRAVSDDDERQEVESYLSA